MKQFLTGSWAFVPGARTLDLSAIDGFDVRHLLGVINLDAAAVIYAPGTAGKGYTTLAGGVLTLAFDTSAMAAGARLMVIYDRDADLDPAWDGAAQRASVNGLLKALWSKLAGTLKVSADSLPLPAGAASAARQDAAAVQLQAIADRLAATLAVSASALPLPTGAATNAKLEELRALLAATLTVALPSGAATAARQDAAAAVLGNILTALAAVLTVKAQIGGADVSAANPMPVQERVVQGAVAIPAKDVDVTPGLVFFVNCTAPGTVMLTLANGSQLPLPLREGPAFLQMAVRQVNAVGTSAEATYFNLI
ncbi:MULTISPECIES: hypothetical protein [Methylobacterium]|uniref:Uncharacterized protein n=2 Tax=Pseudomonadota TaxID=1224 RepID=A0ABQ4SZA7_9HYPH|nr:MULTISPECIES: hypothetical protein [Methylobacterium]PIU06841.1 MAG: hypothetical protein COT56_07675 [Methylobacterium sp. CG09_land_8_20_14_0_10_71_15]PIU16276.1 MAG: hypothetical protein COT28_01270 [Methylobacterium sp. CG08_land_8_20_14_0_20_71_15]GBU17206.1 hypothetical protein AwMethylo_14210 [Methylobacterium sp.]GJE07879.1 hypothetical protein AOPFMNJM_3211 [Methylobacterium jeotgali]